AHERSCVLSRAILADVDDLGTLSVRGESNGGRFNVRWILVHLIEEYARHPGHADLLREAIHGTTGDGAARLGRMTHSSKSGTETAPARPMRLIPLDLVRGFLIGSAELVPGVSGGTIALVTGVYDQLIDSAAHVVLAAKRLVTGPDRISAALAELRRTDWFLVVPVLLGMATAVFTVAGVMESFVTGHPE